MRRNKLLLLGSSLAALLLLVAAAYQENFRKEWRALQRRYASRLPVDAAAGFEVQLRQVVAPALRATDRCVSCHVGMAAGERGVDGDPVLQRHPDVVHDPAEYGCVVCHGGQGRATDRADAHGAVHFWPEPMLPKGKAWAGCGGCHTHLAVPNLADLEAGRATFERNDCLACHRLDGRGGTLRPGATGGVDGGDLSRIGTRPRAADWYERHLARRAAAESGAWRASFGEIPAEERGALEVFLGSRRGAPGIVEAKALFHALGCRGCHKVSGVGGDDGPDLTHAGQRDPGRLDFSEVPGERTLSRWLEEHFRDPARVVRGSGMPLLGLSEREIEALTFYTLSLRTSALPEAFWPRDRILAERFGEREFATDGATIYGAFCSSCHGPRGEGMRYPRMSPFPSVGNPDFLAIVPDSLLRETVRRGRPGRRMPAWEEKEGGLRPAEVDAVVAHVRSLVPVPPEPDPRPPRWVGGDAAEGGRLYAASCAVCHGLAGEGGEGPSLRNPVLLEFATDTYLVETVARGRRGTSMPAFLAAAPTHRQLSRPEIESVVAFVRTWEVKKK